MKFAPIGIPAYVRLGHLQRTIQALQANRIAPQAELFIFSDGPRPGDEAGVQAVREYLKTITGFRRITIVERERNMLRENSRQAQRMLLAEYGKMIFLEDDILTAPSFLEYMNYMLDVYEDDPRVFSISGYSPPFKFPEGYPYDVFFLPRFDPWGFGTWKDRFDQIAMKIPDSIMRGVYLSARNVNRFSRGGLDLVPGALHAYFEPTDSDDMKVNLQQFRLGLVTAYPVQHLADNFGKDGTGVHPKITSRFRVELSREPFQAPRLPADTAPQPEIARRHYEFRSGNYWNRFRQVGWMALTLLTRVFPPMSIVARRLRQ